MGTTFKLIFYASDNVSAQKAADSVFARISMLNDIMSDYFPESELNQLSKTYNEWISVSDDLWELISISQKISRQSKGAFDVSVGPLVRIWRRARRRQEFPDADRLEKARQSVGFKYIKMRKRTQAVKLKRKNMRLDLGGIAKGYAVEAALLVLEEHRIHSALVDGGGDLQCSKAPPSKDGWHISVGKTEKSYLLLENASVATSGDMYQYLEMNGKRYSHIVDPDTGIGLTDQREVTVIAPNATLADALASTFSIMSPQTVTKFCRQYPKVQYRILRREKEQIKSYISDNFILQPQTNNQ